MHVLVHLHAFQHVNLGLSGEKFVCNTVRMRTMKYGGTTP